MPSSAEVSMPLGRRDRRSVRSDFWARAPFPKRYFWPDSAACPVDQVRLDCLPALV